jgi:hypothetical protein
VARTLHLHIPTSFRQKQKPPNARSASLDCEIGCPFPCLHCLRHVDLMAEECFNFAVPVPDLGRVARIRDIAEIQFMAARRRKSDHGQSDNPNQKPARQQRAKLDPQPIAKPKPQPRTNLGEPKANINMHDATLQLGGENLIRDVLIQMERLLNLFERQGAQTVPMSASKTPPTGTPSTPAQQPGAQTNPLGLCLLKDFRGTIQELSAANRSQLIDAALSMLEQVYVHLPLKRAMHAVDPLQSLKILKQRSATLSEGSFHDEMITIFHSLRDLHTIYVLPFPYKNQTACLPFMVEEYFDTSSPVRHYVVSKLVPGFTHPEFTKGVLLKYWNGMPIDRVVELNSQREAGSNEDARHARGLDALTLRPMGMTAPPDEDWVVVGYETLSKQSRELKFEWQVFVPPASPTGINVEAAGPQMACFMGLDARTESVRRARKALFHPEGIRSEQHMATVAFQAGLYQIAPNVSGSVVPAVTASHVGMDFQTSAVRRSKKALFFPDAIAMEQQMDAAVKSAAAPPDQPSISLMPDIFAFKAIQHPGGPFGYIRIYTFDANDPDAFVAEFIRITRLLPCKGLIIDVRGNPGGNIVAGERLLQVLTPQCIEPARFQFINNDRTLELCGPAAAPYGLPQWAPSIGLGIEIGDIYSQGFPLDVIENYNHLGQLYQGPVLLIVDALCYSTTDIFAAGFQDHEIGGILGVHKRTGAGGANVWQYGLLGQILPNRFPPLPNGATFTVALRRSTRVKQNAGVPIEDLGVQVMDVHRMTSRDVLGSNEDLIKEAGDMLAAEKVRSLSGQVSHGPPLTVQVNGENIARVDVYFNGRPASTGDLINGRAVLTLPSWVQPPGILELRGFDGDKLVSVSRRTL